MAEKLDDKDKEILEQFHANPTASIARLAGLVGITIPTAHKRIQRLVREHYLERITRVVDPAHLGYELRYRIEVEVDKRELRDEQISANPSSKPITTQQELAQYIFDELARRPEFKENLSLEDVVVLVGHPADLSITLLAKNRASVLQFILAGIQRLRGIQQTHSGDVAYSAARHSLRAMTQEPDKRSEPDRGSNSRRSAHKPRLGMKKRHG